MHTDGDRGTKPRAEASCGARLPRRIVGRRAWLGALAGASLFLSLGTLLAQVGLFVLSGDRRCGRRLYVGRLDDLPSGRPRFIAGTGGAGTWIRRDGRGDVTAFGAACPHLGCPLGWDEASGAFACGCHGGRFALDGRPLAGPPARAGLALTAAPVHVDVDNRAVYLLLEEVGGG